VSQERHIEQDEGVIGAADETEHQMMLRPDDANSQEAERLAEVF
jgi:hypothetical protein